MKMFIWIWMSIASLDTFTTAKPHETSAKTSSTILTSTASLSTTRAPTSTSSDQQSSTALTSASLNGTRTTTTETGTSANISSTIVASTASLSTSLVTNKQTSTVLISTSLNGDDGQSKSLLIILVVVATVLVISAILVAVNILYRRRCKESTGDDVSKDEPPKELINHDFTCNGQSPLNYESVETLNYDQINDEYIATYSIPARKEKDDSPNAKDKKNHGVNCSINEYNRIEFEKKCSVKTPNYDSVSAMEVKTLDDTYSHISSQSNPASTPTTDEYSHGQFVRKEPQSNNYTKKTTITKEPRVTDYYSHVDLNSDRTKRRQSNIVEEDSYNRIDLDKIASKSRNGEAVRVRTIPISEKCPQTFKEDLQSLDVESEEWPIDNKNYGVSSKDPPQRDIKTVSLPDKYIEFEIGDIYDTPVCKDQQYTVFVKGNNEHISIK
ncbi:hypothetical protein CHS0354_035909 [Potamilus streckersoni]|uniref:Uncharacterized protein n=1 Tax=Potamilus streckersoni TaxID=2493646 RepID=A0AAE0SGL8_9BIVA|nr:hypothetical protein CHS0354_035909 [Potamilus streckersoni]